MPSTYTVYFTRRFTDGLLKGLVHHDHATGSDLAALAARYRIGRRVKAHKALGPGYEIVDASFQSYVRGVAA